MSSMHDASLTLLSAIVSPVLLLLFVFAACGPTSTGPTPTPTSGQGYGTAHGCPSDARVKPEPPTANVTLTLSDANVTVTAHVGDVIEIQLPFGQRWTGPTPSGGGLQLQTPAGYASTTKGMCIWRFHALGAGTTRLTFFARALCRKDQPCPHYVLAIPFTIVVP